MKATKPIRVEQCLIVRLEKRAREFSVMARLRIYDP